MNMIPIENIVVGKRLRQIRREAVELLAGSIGEVGLMNPIVVSPILDDEGQETDLFRLIAGNHRLEAYKQLGKTEIPATIGTGSDVDQRLAEIDENLCRADLTHLERAEHLAERKSLYEMMHPQTKQGTAGAHAANRSMGNSSDATEIISFASDTAKKTGSTDRNIRQAVRRANNISQEVRDSIRDVASIADNSLELDALASLEESEQKAAVRAVLDGKARSIREVVRQKEEATRPQVTISSQTGADPEDAAESSETPVPSGSVDWKRMYKDVSGEALAQKERIRTLNKERTALKARIKELESSPSEPAPSPANFMAELEEWKRRALEAEERCIYLGHQLDEINADPVRQTNRGAALKAMLDELENNLANDPGAFQMETLDMFESRLSDLVFLIKSVKRR
ncbi:MAG: ParB N-terminal domain-containing protein [Magnetococcales bacterium]|nr:ParB N-terminal domain-containing protein [Magnetococcales bacterium]MBF0115504.1 ParB N-terminal domain-containing protein [Magnetococcales bacterium]